MEKTKKSLSAAVKVKKKMTKEQMQLAIIKKKECDAKALNIVMQLLEPRVDSAWLIENLKNINKCHMEDVIEERAITKLCGYVLCQKQITVIMNQRYHISLKEKKVYDVTKRKNFCSSSCFGASNYLLEQMLTSPLWLRDKEEIPKFKIFSRNTSLVGTSHGELIDITIINPCTKDDVEQPSVEDKKEQIISKDVIDVSTEQKSCAQPVISNKEISGNIETFVLETIKNFNIDSTDLKKDSENLLSTNNEQSIDNTLKSSKKVEFEDTILENKQEIKQVKSVIEEDKIVKKPIEKIVKSNDKESNIIEQHIYFTPSENNSHMSPNMEININLKDEHNQMHPSQTEHSSICDKKLQINTSQNIQTFTNDKTDEKIEINQKLLLESPIEKVNKKIEKIRSTKKKKHTEEKTNIVINLAAKVEQSFQEWISEETIHLLFGDDYIKKEAIEKIQTQDKYSILCEKLNRLQFQDEQEDIENLEKPALKPAPHFSVLQEEGEKLELKVRAFYQGKTEIAEPKKLVKSEETTSLDTFLPLTDVHAPQTLRRKIFLDRLDQVLPDLLRTLAGNNEVYARVSLNYTSVRCTAVKALVHTFSLSAKNIIFKTAEWTLVGLVIIKMLSLLDPWLANLLLTKQANMYISMILTSYKLDPHYLNLLVASYNPNVNPR